MEEADEWKRQTEGRGRQTKEMDGQKRQTDRRGGRMEEPEGPMMRYINFLYQKQIRKSIDNLNFILP